MIELFALIGIRLAPEAVETFDESAYREHITRFLDHFDYGNSNILVIEDFHYLFSNGKAEETYTELFLDLLATRKTYNNNRVILTSDQLLDFPNRAENTTFSHRLNRLNDEFIRETITYYVKSLDSRWAITPPKIPNEIVEMAVGHPLAARLLADHYIKFPPEALVRNYAVYRRFQSKFISIILEDIEFSDEERDFLAFASIFRRPVSIEALLKWGNEEKVLDLIEQLTKKFYIDVEEGKYVVHQLLRTYFLNKMPDKEQGNHKKAEQYYFEANSRPNGLVDTPEALGEMYHHLTASGDQDRARRIPKLYGKNIRQVAKSAIAKHDYDTAITYLKMLYDEKAYDKEDCFLMAISYAYKSVYDKCDNWQEADKYFNEAIKDNPNDYYLQRYAYINIKDKHRLRQAETDLHQAISINRNKPEILTTMAMLKFKQNENLNTVQEYFDKAKAIDENNKFYLTEYMLYLLQTGDPNVKEVIDKAFDLHGYDFRIKAIYERYYQEHGDQAFDSSVEMEDPLAEEEELSEE